MLVSSQFWALPSNFPSCPCTVSWLGRVAPLAGTTLCRFSNDGTPGHCNCLRAYQLPKNGECPPWRLPLNAHVAGWRPGPLPWVPVPNALPTRPMAPRAPHHAGNPCPLRYPGPPWALGLPRPTSQVPGVPTQRYSPFAATLPARQQGSCTPPNGFRAYIPTNKTTSILSI